MANPEHLKIIKNGAKTWNNWRTANPEITPDLSGAKLIGADLSYADLGYADLIGATLIGAKLIEATLIEAKLSGADLSKADLREADLHIADLREAKLTEANLRRASLFIANLYEANLNNAVLSEADLLRADLREAKLIEAKLIEANLNGADLSKADLSGADLRGASLVHTTVEKAKITGCSIYAVNVWDLFGEFEEQENLIITPEGESEITVDNIKIAQFIYLILNNQEIRDVINTLTSKTVLILGRFSIPERKAILDKLKNKLREHDLLPIVFDFERPTNRDFTETIKTLAGMACFVIADITNPKSSPLELDATVPDYQIPFVPIIQENENPFSMMENLQTKYNWVLDTLTYNTGDDLIEVLQQAVIDPAFEKHKQLQLIKATRQQTKSVRDFVKE